MPGFLPTCCIRPYDSVPSTKASPKSCPDETTFDNACQKGNANVAEKFLKHNSDWVIQRKNYPLHVAAQNGHPNIIKLLYDNGVDLNQPITDLGGTALHIASQNGRTETVRQLLNLGATIDCPRQDGTTPLTLALLKSQFGVSEVLLENSADQQPLFPKSIPKATSWKEFAYMEEDKQGLTALDFASFQGHAKTVDFFLTHGADANHEDHRGITALHQAANNGHCKVIHAIMRHTGAGPGAIDVSKKDNDGNTPLMLAYLKNHHDTVAALKEYDADPNVELTNIKTNPLLHSADWQNRSTPLHIAAQNGHLKKSGK